MAFASGGAHALGMGEIEVNTALNEPLNAKIKLFSVTPEELDTLKVKLASQDIFSRMGIDRMPVLRNLEFELVSKGQGAPYIKVSSTKAVKEPFLDFILSINWSSGQMMREYTLLLDPPVFDRGEQAGRISAAATQPSEVIREEPAPAATSRSAASGSYGPTDRSDTLWAVAQKMRPNSSISVPQMMIALLKENPEAFDDNNINNLKAGYILRQPEMDVITALGKQEAAAESNRQYQDWLAAKGRTPAPAGRQQRVAKPAGEAATEQAAATPATPPPSAAAPQGKSEARLQLLSPDEEARIRAGVGSETSGEAPEALRQQLAIAQETAEATRQENAELRNRLDELEKQLQSVQKLLTLRDDTLGALQADAQQQGETAQAETETQQAAAPTTTEKPAEKAAAAAKAPAKPAPQPKAAEPALLDEILANPTYLYAAGGGLVVVLLLVALIMRRRRQNDENDFTVMTPVAAAPEGGAGGKQGAAAAVAAPAVAAAEADAEEEVAIGDIGGGLGTIQAEESEIDPIAEADVYLAYRRYEQAEALLKEAISADDERHELKLKLLEIYHATKDVDSFEAQAESLYAALGGQNEELWNQAVEMGRELLPEHPLFSNGAAPAGDDAGVDLGIESPDSGGQLGGDELNFDDEPQALAEDGSGLSDDDLASSLGLGGLDETAESDTAAALDELSDLSESATTKAPEAEEADISLDDLGDLDLDLDLDLDGDENAGLAAEDGTKDDAAIGLEDFDLDSEGLEDIAEMGETAEELQGLDEPDLERRADADTEKREEAFDLGEDLAESLDSEVADLGEGLDDFGSVDSDEMGAGAEYMGLDDMLAEESPTATDEISEDIGELDAEQKRELSLSEGEEHLDHSEDPYAEVDLDSFSSGASESWQIEAAHSVFHTREVSSETDGLLDSARRKEEERDNSVDMDFSSDAVEGEEQASPATEVDDTVVADEPEDSAAVVDEDSIDPLADIADLGEMDFGDLSDEDNDDIFDSSDDVVGTKLDLAKAYIDMGDQDGARSILGEVVEEGDDDQRQLAEQLMQQIS